MFVSPSFLASLPTGLHPADLGWHAAPPSFYPDCAGPALINMEIADLDHDGDALQFIIAHACDTETSSLAVCAGGTWFSSESTQDWPVLDHLFGRAVWQEFVDEHEQDARHERDQEAEAEAIRMTSEVACALHFADLVDAWRYSRADDAARVEVKGRTIAFAFGWDAEARTLGFTYTVYASPIDAVDLESELTTHGLAVADEESAGELMREVIESLA